MVSYLKGYKTLGNKLISCLDPYQKIEDTLSKAGFTGLHVFVLRPDLPGEPPVPAQGCTAFQHCFRLKLGRRSEAAQRLGDFSQTE